MSKILTLQPRHAKTYNLKRLAQFIGHTGLVYEYKSGDYMGQSTIRTIHNSVQWLDGIFYEVELDNKQSRFGRVSQKFRGWGEFRKQKKPPHTEVLYTFTLKYKVVGANQVQSLVLRSINNCSNEELTNAIKLAALRLEDHCITQPVAEFLLDKCYAELQRRLDWTDREKGKKRGQSQNNQSQAPVDPPT